MKAIEDRKVASDKSTIVGKHRVDLYGEQVQVGDNITWADVPHTVVRLEGVVKDAGDGSLYSTVAVTD